MKEHRKNGLQAVWKNFKGFTNREVKKSTLACNAQSMLAHPLCVKFKQLIGSRSLKNFTVTVNNTTNARTLFYPNLLGSGGRPTRNKSVRVEPGYVGILKVLDDGHLQILPEP